MKFSIEAINERAEQLLAQINGPDTFPRQVVFGLHETARILGMSASGARILLDREGIEILAMGQQRGGVPAHELARLQLILEAKGRARTDAQMWGKAKVQLEKAPA